MQLLVCCLFAALVLWVFVFDLLLSGCFYGNWELFADWLFVCGWCWFGWLLLLGVLVVDFACVGFVWMCWFLYLIEFGCLLLIVLR